MKQVVFIGIVCAAFAACTTTPPASVGTARPPEPRALMQLAQLGYREQARFERCRSHDCPQPSPKTLGPAPQATIQQASPATNLARPTPVEEFLGGEERIGAIVEVFPIRSVGPFPTTQLRDLFPAGSAAQAVEASPADPLPVTEPPATEGANASP